MGATFGRMENLAGVASSSLLLSLLSCCFFLAMASKMDFLPVLSSFFLPLSVGSLVLAMLFWAELALGESAFPPMGFPFSLLRYDSPSDTGFWAMASNPTDFCTPLSAFSELFLPSELRILFAMYAGTLSFCTTGLSDFL